MTTVITLRNEYEGRVQEFFQNEHNDLREAEEVFLSIAQIGEHFSLLFGETKADDIMTQILDELVPGYAYRFEDKNSAALQWRSRLEEVDTELLIETSSLMQNVLWLHAFAYFGIYPGADGGSFGAPDNIRDWVASTCELVEKLRSLASTADTRQLESTCLAAQARLKYDDNQPMTRDELAALSRTSLKRLQNALYGKSEGAPVLGKGGVIEPASAAQWLSDRDYKPSIWPAMAELRPFSGDWGEDTVYETQEAIQRYEDYVFVPVAKDGSMFTPTLERNGHYTIGEKGAETKLSAYTDALEALGAMSKAKWRRPNDNGNWGIVTAEGWRRARLSELSSSS